jgi:hypothetical protein
MFIQSAVPFSRSCPNQGRTVDLPAVALSRLYARLFNAMNHQAHFADRNPFGA